MLVGRGMTKRMLALSIVGGFWLIASPAIADDDPKICFRESGDVAIAACTRVIDSKSATIRQRSDAYNNRGQEWYAKKDYDRAIADFNAAIALNPKGLANYGVAAIQARVNKGNAYSMKGEASLAIESYTAAIAFDAEYPAAYTGRGLQYKKTGNIDGATADFKTALTLKAKYQDGQWALDTARKQIEALNGK